MSAPATIAFGLFFIGVALGLAQLWGQIFAPETFFKLAITDGALFVVVIAWMVVVRERRDSDRLRKDRRLG
jgi:Mn2+/Fe2+ NRAMP family transporter